ncbi:hydroxymethylbilane synthase [Actinotalea sp. BY-33]|uniref:Porphobilinogen deaminase n=1 Tax=Actinotalea soli TaxID=2819234 RepID=A0A939LS08_9CELL|nr:hydroxymethylbilane synthase [Actinotalea soli]MBO1751069.1 hydroxymethylbilane synthase [Actinotalea soli]
MSAATSTVRIGTRGSALALTQTGHVADALRATTGWEEEQVELVRVRTEGDVLTGSLASLGGTGVFVVALREALLMGRCDLAVHSLKDLPTAEAPALTVAAVPRREDPRDALCARDGLGLMDLPAGATVGTGSPRRAAQLLASRPDLQVVDIRGNVGTRLGRVPGLGDGPGDLDAVVLAAAGLRRLDLDEGVVSELLDPTVLCPAPGQGALAIECRTEDAELRDTLAALDHEPTRLAVTAERTLLADLEAGCAAPLGALGTLDGDRLYLDAVVLRPDGGAQLRASSSVQLGSASRADRDAAARGLGSELARRLLAEGAAELAGLGQHQGGTP